MILYIHGKGGSAGEAEHYRTLFPGENVLGLDYSAQTPWEAKAEFPALFDSVCGENADVTLIANSIGAYYAMCSLPEKQIARAFFISPIMTIRWRKAKKLFAARLCRAAKQHSCLAIYSFQ